MIKHLLLILLLTISAFRAGAQTLSLEQAINMARQRSFEAQLARFSFLASYWTYRSYKAELLPAVNLTGLLGDFNHSRGYP